MCLRAVWWKFMEDSEERTAFSCWVESEHVGTSSSESEKNLYQTTWQHIPEDGILHEHRRENLRSHTIKCSVTRYQYDCTIIQNIKPWSLEIVMLHRMRKIIEDGRRDKRSDCGIFEGGVMTRISRWRTEEDKGIHQLGESISKPRFVSYVLLPNKA
jgi:hypothetical protein